MPYPMVHMLIACRVMEKTGQIERPGDFILGSVAPDAVHFHKGFLPEMKETTHLWKGSGPAWGITTDSERWKENIVRFREILSGTEVCENPDFAAGYLIHLLTDYWYDVRVYRPLRERLEKMEDSGAADFARYRQEAHGFDQWLYYISPDRERIWELLRIGQPCSMEGLIMQKDVERQKQSILQEQFANSEKYDIACSWYCTRNRMEDFMEECVRMISDFWM